MLSIKEIWSIFGRWQSRNDLYGCAECGSIRRKKDEEKAKEVIAHDDIVDDLFIKSREDVISLIHDNPEEGLVRRIYL